MGMKLRSCEKGCAKLYLALSFWGPLRHHYPDSKGNPGVSW